MAGGKRGAVVRRRLQGVAFLVAIVVLLGLAVATYQKAFTPVAHVAMQTDTIGNQLQKSSDVKVRGLIVGEVREVHAGLQHATIDMAIDPQYLSEIPANVTALLLPKTLFGERYVDLEIPDRPSPERLKDGDTIGEDRSADAIELQKVINDLLPLLEAVQPQDLSFTLGAIADAVRGRGNALGENLASTGTYIGGINTVLPQLESDIGKVADFSDTYNSAADDLLGVLDDLSTTSNTVVDQKQQLKRTFTVVGSSSTTLADFLSTNEQNLIQLASSSKPVLGTFARYSPEYPCLLNGLARFNPIISSAFGAPGSPYIRLNLTVNFPQRNPYQPGDQPQYVANSGPTCAGLNDIDGIIAGAARGQYYCPASIPDGVESSDNSVSGDPRCQGGTTTPVVGTGGVAGQGQSVPSTSPVGSRSELDFVKGILGYETGSSPGKVSDLAASSLAPVLRGTEVNLP